jgi:hypothetical protein
MKLRTQSSSAPLCLKPQPPRINYWALILSGVYGDSSVGITTCYGLDYPGIESLWRRDFPRPSRLALDPPSLLYNGYRVFPGGKVRPGRGVEHPPAIYNEVKETAKFSWPLLGLTSNNIWWIVEITHLPNMRVFSGLPLIPPSIPQHPILKHHQPVWFSEQERPTVTSLQDTRHICTAVYTVCHVVKTVKGWH